MVELAIKLSELYAWIDKQGIPVEEIKRRWGAAFEHRVREINFQVKRLDECQVKLQNLLSCDDYGKLCERFLADKNAEELKKL